MSYGWLTESALLPKKKKEIKVDDEGSLFGLKAVMLREKEKMQQGSAKRVIHQVKKPHRNPGIDQRIRKDETSSASIDNRIRDSVRSMQLKQRVYEELQTGKQNVSRLLVDFAGKALQHDQDDEEYQHYREEFYAGKLEELRRHREQAPVQTLGERDYRERIAWEKEVLGQLSGTVEEKVKVKQVFDRKMHEDEKAALAKVRQELNDQQRIKEQARKRREQINQQRIFKLKKLNILPDDDLEDKKAPEATNEHQMAVQQPMTPKQQGQIAVQQSEDPQKQETKQEVLQQTIIPKEGQAVQKQE